jgi:ankyrin repeat protein
MNNYPSFSNMFYYQGNPCSALFSAAFRGYKDIAELLIANGASVDAVDNSGETPLHIAAMEGHQAIVELLINNGAQIHIQAKDGCTPLYLAACSRHQKVSQFLLNCGAAIEPDIALMLGDIELVKQYVELGVDINSKLAKGYAKGESWLNKAISLQNASLIQFLLDNGARVNEKTGTFNLSPLHVASTGIRGKTRQDICELLIAYGADVNSKDINKETPLHWAAKVGCENIVEFLLDCDANIKILNQSKRSALHTAAAHHHLQIVKILLSRGAEVNLVDTQGITPLFSACSKAGGEEIIEALVFHGADVNVRDNRGFSPLHLAVVQNNKNIVELLLAHGAREGLE